MEEWKPLNMKLRSWVISQLLRLEQTSSSAVRAILRMFKIDSKTLGNKSSALSFKSKIDLLYDLGELEKTEYSHLLKLMEIRNQFAHNPNVTCFEDFDVINEGINNYLLKFVTEEIKTETNREAKLRTVFKELFKRTAGKLLTIEIEYTRGIQEEIRKHVNHIAIKNLDEIWKRAIERNTKNKISTPVPYLLKSNEIEIDTFYVDFQIVLSEFTNEQLNKINEGNLEKILKQKETFQKKADDKN